jgi:hypothetical protein
LSSGSKSEKRCIIIIILFFLDLELPIIIMKEKKGSAQVGNLLERRTWFEYRFLLL